MLAPQVLEKRDKLYFFVVVLILRMAGQRRPPAGVWQRRGEWAGENPVGGDAPWYLIAH